MLVVKNAHLIALQTDVAALREEAQDRSHDEPDRHQCRNGHHRTVEHVAVDSGGGRGGWQGQAGPGRADAARTSPLFVAVDHGTLSCGEYNKLK